MLAVLSIFAVHFHPSSDQTSPVFILPPKDPPPSEYLTLRGWGRGGLHTSCIAMVTLLLAVWMDFNSYNHDCTNRVLEVQDLYGNQDT